MIMYKYIFFLQLLDSCDVRSILKTLEFYDSNLIDDSFSLSLSLIISLS